MTYERIATYAGIIVAVVYAIVYTICSLVKASKTSKKSALLAFIEQSMKSVETLSKYMAGVTGEEKLEMCLQMVKQYCDYIRYNYDEEWIRQAVEEKIDFSKKVNYKEEMSEENVV